MQQLLNKVHDDTIFERCDFVVALAQFLIYNDKSATPIRMAPFRAMWVLANAAGLLRKKSDS